MRCNFLSRSARSSIRLNTQPTTPTIRAPSTAGTKPLTWNGTFSFPDAQLASQNSRPFTMMLISPNVTT
jgi:hypothetical protein